MPPNKTDHDPASDPAGAISNQNREESQSGHRDDETHPEPRTTGKGPKPRERRDPSSGAAKEGSQATGHRQNAG